jgi:hypothetical protein
LVAPSTPGSEISVRDVAELLVAQARFYRAREH